MRIYTNIILNIHFKIFIQISPVTSFLLRLRQQCKKELFLTMYDIKTICSITDSTVPSPCETKRILTLISVCLHISGVYGIRPGVYYICFFSGVL